MSPGPCILQVYICLSSVDSQSCLFQMLAEHEKKEEEEKQSMAAWP